MRCTSVITAARTTTDNGFAERYTGRGTKDMPARTPLSGRRLTEWLERRGHDTVAARGIGPDPRDRLHGPAPIRGDGETYFSETDKLRRHHDHNGHSDLNRTLVLSQPPNNNYPNRLAEGRSKAIGPTLRFQALPIPRLTEY